MHVYCIRTRPNVTCLAIKWAIQASSKPSHCYPILYFAVLPPHKRIPITPSWQPGIIEEMEAAVGAAGWLLGKTLKKLSNELVAAFVASSELGHNFESIKRHLLYTQGLLHAAQGRDMRSNPDPGLQGLLVELSKKADEAEDVLDEIHYFMIQDMLDGTSEATVQEPAALQVGDVLRSHARDGRHALRHTIGNWLPCFSCSPTQHAVPAVNSSDPHDATNSGTANGGGGPADKLSFHRAALSLRIESIIVEMNTICELTSNLLKIANHSIPATVTLKRSSTSLLHKQDTLFGRTVMFEQTVNAITSGTYHSETLSVLPFVGVGGIGKTTFIQHMYNDKRIEGHFTIMVWVCVSTDFDVLKLTRETLSCIPATGKEEYNCTNEVSNLDQAQKSIAKRLKSKRFLIVLDDVCKCKSETDWKNLLAPFTKGETTGSMILVTTRLPSIANLVKTTDPIELLRLEPNDFLTLFEKCIFGDSKPGHYEDDLIDVARGIVEELKGSPLAAKAVGRLLRKNHSREYWVEVLQKKEWKTSKNDDDIMPSLEISYDYLPFRLKKCFSYCALFPEDYKFYNVEITSFWIAIGILDSSCQNDNNYLEELVDNGFLMKGVDSSNDQYYVMHDLLHELSRNVSSQECVNISSLSFSVDDIPKSAQHLSITIDNIYDDSFVEEISKLKSTIDFQNLRTLMIFGYHDAEIANIFKDTFEEIKGLRVLFIAANTGNYLPNNFPNLIHLQYLKISSPFHLKEITLPSTLSRFYHLKFLDLNGWHGSETLPKDISRLVNLRYLHFSKNTHSNIPEVGKMKCLHELKEFRVKKENVGFELTELGELRELGGELSIHNLETVASKVEASAAKLKNKRNLKELRLVWGAKHQTIDDDVLDGLQPHPNLRVLGIINPGIAPCPRWLCGDISTKRLEALHLEGISWVTLPAFEQLPHLTSLTLKNIASMRVFGPGFSGVTKRSFMHLKKIVFEDMPELVEWVGEPNSHLFSTLESIKFKDCRLLTKFPFLECSDCFTNLCELDICDGPELSHFPTMPHTSSLTFIRVENGSSTLSYRGKYLTVEDYNSALAFQYMDKAETVTIEHVSHIPLSELQKLNSLRSLAVKRCDHMFYAELDDSVTLHSVQDLHLDELCMNGEVFSKVLKCFPALCKLSITKCNSMELLHVEDGGGLWDLTMLKSFSATSNSCLRMFSQWPMGEVGGDHTVKPFPPSLRKLQIFKDSSIKSMALLSNLTSLTHLSLADCEELTMDGFNPLITVKLKELAIHNKEKIAIAGDLLLEVERSGLMHKGSFELEFFEVDCISTVLVDPICNHLATTLHTLFFSHDMRVETFTKEQEQALQLLTSLRHLKFEDCYDMQSLPGGLDRLSSLVELEIFGCEKIRLLPPKEGLPASLERLFVWYCGPELIEQAMKLRGDPSFSALVSIL
ncbi:unnamed protein product [Triticum turgidum subsp. durum]|uniref:NB-ARC domain-containing protein n=1 Tax=Triticum turgidum subsp. durum TaxID=4567 RepID=A0A9R0YYA6_TRITD|nr:unnamed protein product [Triticum turgidum subsp. durum]